MFGSRRDIDWWYTYIKFRDPRLLLSPTEQTPLWRRRSFPTFFGSRNCEISSGRLYAGFNGLSTGNGWYFIFVPCFEEGVRSKLQRAENIR